MRILAPIALAVGLLLSPFIWIAIQVIILEPLGFYDIHVSEIPEGPNNCIKITEEWYRGCWEIRER